MAEKVMKDIKEDFLHCAICVDRLKNPKMLPCIHTFCCECLTKYAESCREEQLTCPTCRKEFELPENGVHELQTNFHLVSLGDRIDLFEKLTSCTEKPQQCDSCNIKEVSTYCLDCENVFCIACNDHHARFPALRSHSVVPVEKFKERHFRDSLKNTKVPFCDLHSSEKLRFYCKTCLKMICRDCTIVQHPRPEHEYVEAPSQVDDMKKLLTKLLQESQTQLESKLRYVDEGNKGAKSVRNTSESLKQEIVTCYQQMMKTIQHNLKSEMENLCANVTDIQKSQLANIGGCVKVASTWIERAQNTHKMTQKIMEESNTWELLAMSKDLIFAFHSLRSDCKEFEWHRSDMEHGFPIFSPASTPSLNLGGLIDEMDIVVKDPEGNFITCTFHFQSSTLRLTRLRKEFNYEAARADSVPPYKWEKYVPGYANVTAAADNRNCVFVGLGRWLAKFSFSSKAIEAFWDTSEHEESFITCIDFNCSRETLFLVHNNNSPVRETSQKAIRKKSQEEKMAWGCTYEVPGDHTPLKSIITTSDAIFCTSCNHDKQIVLLIKYAEFLCKDITPPNNVGNPKFITVLNGAYTENTREICQPSNLRRHINVKDCRCYALWSGQKLSKAPDSVMIITEYDSIEQILINSWTVHGGNAYPLACFYDSYKNELNVCDKFGRVKACQQA
ncbi:E3 ubiquitin-protein ligase TRIM56 [Holothuria leucospilota]|uniref:E3 ubiquitin-protein ligase TRIM56 n=1 Tax=Holothuria leucospilota TaxID=206669 RepID=A0A9Q1BV87_HOLLE|nr:E3 ubiquitin-protein ligase TRIM56 [Holothuria leucospilota]